MTKVNIVNNSDVATVYLVGAGPGDPGLLTVAGAEALRQAAVVVYDFLANAELLKLAPAGAERIYVGKSASQHTKTQEEINQILVEKAREVGGKRKTLNAERGNLAIVRLKGGDPFVFGRGGEEAEFLGRHGVPFVIVPGITSGIAAPAYAGIPVTHRDFASTITLVTGHEKEKSEDRSEKTEEEGEARVNYEALVKLDGTLVFYMGVKSLPLIAERLMGAGMSAETPAAVIRWGTHPHQRTIMGTLATLPGLVAAAGIKPPAITIVGKVVGLRESLNWFESRPLFGQRVMVTRTRQQASELSRLLAAAGAEVLEAPTIEIVPPTEDEWVEIDRTLLQMPAYDWIVFTSPNGVRAAWERLRHLTFDARHFGASHIAAIGPATAEALEAIGIVPDLVPEKFVGEDLARALTEFFAEKDEAIEGKRFLLLRADIARPVLREELLKLGAMVDDLEIYYTIRPAGLPADVINALNSDAPPTWVTFTSASTATNLWEMLTPEQRASVARMKRASIGPVTTAALKELGNGEWVPTAEADPHTIETLARALQG